MESSHRMIVDVFFDIARGSALECAACLDVMALKQLIDREQAKQGKEYLSSIVAMLIGLIKSNSKWRKH